MRVDELELDLLTNRYIAFIRSDTEKYFLFENEIKKKKTFNNYRNFLGFFYLYEWNIL